MFPSVLRFGCVTSQLYAKHCPTHIVPKKSSNGFGISIDMFIQLQQIFLTNYTIQIVHEKAFGRQNGTSNGLVAKIASNEVDITNMLDYTTERNEVVTYVLPFLHYDPLSVLFNPRHRTVKMLLFEPYEWPVWFCWILFYLSIVKLSHITISHPMTFFHHAFSVSFQQRSSWKWTGVVPKLLVTFWALMAGRFGQANYRLGFLDRLMPKEDRLDFHNLPEYISAGHYQFVEVPHFASYEEILNEENEIFDSLRKALVVNPPTFFSTASSLLDHISKTTGTVALATTDIARYAQLKNPWLVVAEAKYTPLPVPIAVLGPNMHNHSLYLTLSRAVSYLHEYGIWEKIMKPYRRPYEVKATRTTNALQFLQMFQVFKVFVFCIFSCSICLLIEMLWAFGFD